MTNHRLTPLERAILEAICERNPSDRAALEAQFAAATVRSRENTGVGFFTHFAVERSSVPAIGGANPRGGPETKIDGLRNGMGFVLFLDEGYANFLEGYTYGESTAAINLATASFEILMDKA